MARKYKSDVMRSAHEAMADLAEIGAVDKTTMREFDRMCLTKAVKLSAPEIRAIRERAGALSIGCVDDWSEPFAIVGGDKNPGMR